MPYRMAEYSFEIIRDAIDEKQIKKKDYKLSKVIPILLYTGNGEWKVADSMRQEVYGELEELGINVKYKPIDMNAYSKQSLLDMNSNVRKRLKTKTNRNYKKDELYYFTLHLFWLFYCFLFVATL